MFVSEFLNSFMKSSSFNVSLYKSVIVGFVYNSYKAEFDRDKNIPMKYAIDYEDPYLMNLVNEFINMGGDPNLECYINYFDKSYDSRYIKTISLNDIINEYDSKKLVR